jgi:hypothetical protein
VNWGLKIVDRIADKDEKTDFDIPSGQNVF